MFRVPNAPWITSNHRRGSMRCQRCGEEWDHTRHPTPETFLSQLARFGRKHRECPAPKQAKTTEVSS